MRIGLRGGCRSPLRAGPGITSVPECQQFPLRLIVSVRPWLPWGCLSALPANPKYHPCPSPLRICSAWVRPGPGHTWGTWEETPLRLEGQVLRFPPMRHSSTVHRATPCLPLSSTSHIPGLAHASVCWAPQALVALLGIWVSLSRCPPKILSKCNVT